MAELTRERAGQPARAAFAVLLEHPDGMQARDLIEAARQRFVLTEFEHGTYPDGSSRFDRFVDVPTSFESN